ncbi:MAG: hypothetical protein M1827_000299 [Pycnora praestabilis]|nr:MAG: hypothetical protein M1827_000299 [Pycnora praestabilis]
MSFQTIDQMAGRHNDGFDSSINLVDGPPPLYRYDNIEKSPTGSRWHPRNWSRKMWIYVAVGIIILLVAVIVGAVEGTKDNAYPDYSKLDYSLQDTYSGSSFFDNFDYFTGYDPSGGFVHYVDQPGSVQQNLTYASSTSAILRVDTTNTDASTGRNSVRISSKIQYDSGLFIFDILHTPYGCGTWPALWLSDQANWPMNGEIDVVEAVNTATAGNQMTLHTTKGCTMKAKRKESGKALTNNCWNGTDDNAGCGVQGATDTYGQALNKNRGGVYALEWRTAGIRIWFFPRASIPSNISTFTSTSASNTNSITPDPSVWGEPLADFPSTDCSISNHFRNQSIIANIDLCGDWAGQAKYFTEEAGCPGTCESLVTSNATGFDEAYWEFGAFQVYTAS